MTEANGNAGSGDILGAGVPAGGVTPPAPSNQPAQPQAEPNFDDLPKWTAALTPATRKAHFEDLKAINGPEDITKMAFDLRKQMEGAIIPPGKDAPKEAVDAYLTKIGVPLDKSGYTLDVPKDTGTATIIEGLTALAHAERIPNDQLKKVASYLVEAEKAAGTQLEQAMESLKQESVAKLRQEYGDKYDAKIARANSMLTKYGGESFQGFLNETRLGNNREFVSMMVKLSSLLSDDLLNQGPSSPPRASDDYYSFPATPGME